MLFFHCTTQLFPRPFLLSVVAHALVYFARLEGSGDQTKHAHDNLFRPFEQVTRIVVAICIYIILCTCGYMPQTLYCAYTEYPL